MFGYPNEDRRNRLFLKVENSKWSKVSYYCGHGKSSSADGRLEPLSFEPIAADMQIIMQSAAGNTDYYVGLSYAEGLGKVLLLAFASMSVDPDP